MKQIVSQKTGLGFSREQIVWLAFVGALGSCSQSTSLGKLSVSDWQSAGWHYTFDSKGGHGAALYRFGDRSKEHFIAMCDRVPVFILDSPAYDIGATSFSLRIDDHEWTLSRTWDVEANGLHIDEPRFAKYFATAKHRISYRVGTWTIEIPPSPLIAKLVNECAAWNARSATSANSRDGRTQN